MSPGIFRPKSAVSIKNARNTLKIPPEICCESTVTRVAAAIKPSRHTADVGSYWYATIMASDF